MDVRFLHLLRPYRFESPFAGEFVLLLLITETRVTPEERQVLLRSILDARCRYVMCRGADCEEWHDAIDDEINVAGMGAEDEGDPPPHFVMTTWHEDESLQETLEFAAVNTAFDDFVPTVIVVAEIGGDGHELVRARTLWKRLARGTGP